MPKVFTSKSQRTGEVGEHIAARYLVAKGFTVIERNYTKKWGEIDIIARKDQKLYIIEVKSKTVVDFELSPNGYRPEENMHPRKIARLKRAIQTYLLERKVRGEWQFDLVIVYLNKNDNQAKVRTLENLIL